MKHAILTLALLATMATVSVAQDNNNQRPQRMNPTEMMNRRLESMKQAYGLTDEQVAQIKALNEKMFQNGTRQRPEAGQRQEGRERSEAGQRPERRQRSEEGQRPQAGQRGQRGGMGFGQRSEEYNNELKKIMTEEQYKAYQADQEKRRQERGQRGGGFGQRRGGQN